MERAYLKLAGTGRATTTGSPADICDGADGGKAEPAVRLADPACRQADSTRLAGDAPKMLLS